VPNDDEGVEQLRRELAAEQGTFLLTLRGKASNGTRLPLPALKRRCGGLAGIIKTTAS
jgi:hypothetical protein